MIPQLAQFERVVFFTGAGMSAESGVPTYRGQGGLWKHYDYERYACQTAFDRDPEGVWDFHNYRRELVGACRPHRGHDVIVAAEQQLSRVTVVTQNIDGMHQLAGSTGVTELHGSLWRVRCDRCGETQSGYDSPLADLHCGGCGGWWRPDIVWFGDMLNEAVVQSAVSQISQCDLLVAVGTSAVVYPAAQLPQLAAKGGAVLVEINPEPTPMSALYHHHLRGPASEMLLAMAEGLALPPA